MSFTKPFYPHQVIELPPIAMEVTHCGLPQSWGAHGGHWTQAQVPAAHARGSGPRFSALVGELAGTDGNGQWMGQPFCASVLQVPISLGAMQKVLDRVAQALEPHYSAMATPARHALVS